MGFILEPSLHHRGKRGSENPDTDCRWQMMTHYSPDATLLCKDKDESCLSKKENLKVSFSISLFWGNLKDSSWDKFIYLKFLFLFRATPAAVEVPRLGVKWELHLLTMPQPQQCQILVTSAIYAAACGNTGPLIRWMRPGIEPASSQRLCQVLNPLSHSGNPFLK